MKSISFIQEALKALDNEVQELLMNVSISLTEKDDFMLPLLQQKRVLDQTLADLEYLKANPPAKGGTCKTGTIRQEMEAKKNT